jgi:hypothetical protein
MRLVPEYRADRALMQAVDPELAPARAPTTGRP